MNKIISSVWNEIWIRKLNQCVEFNECFLIAVWLHAPALFKWIFITTLENMVFSSKSHPLLICLMSFRKHIVFPICPKWCLHVHSTHPFLMSYALSVPLSTCRISSYSIRISLRFNVTTMFQSKILQPRLAVQNMKRSKSRKRSSIPQIYSSYPRIITQSR